MSWISQRLGVKTGERFTIEGFDNVVYYLKVDGSYVTMPPMAPDSSRYFIKALENPEFVKKCNDYDYQTIVHLQSLSALFPNGTLKKDFCTGTTVETTEGKRYDIPPTICPGVPMGKSVKLANVIIVDPSTRWEWDSNSYLKVQAKPGNVDRISMTGDIDYISDILN